MSARKTQSNEPLFVAISDIHFNLNTLDVASFALSGALKRAQALNIPLVIAGDLNDSKDIIRAKVANRLITVLEGATVPIYILEGNHDRIHEKASEHGLNYLRPYATIIDTPEVHFGVGFIPYQSDSEGFKDKVNSLNLKSGSLLVVHQGFLGAFMGDYVQDKTSVSPDVVKKLKVFSGHYHKHQTLGSVTYIGSPYTITFGEANDGDKGFLIVNQDGSYEQEALNLRRHYVLERTAKEITKMIENNAPFLIPSYSPIWLKVKGPIDELQKINKTLVGNSLIGHNDFKLDLIPNDKENVDLSVITNVSKEDMLDILIEGLTTNVDEQLRLKALWRELVS